MDEKYEEVNFQEVNRDIIEEFKKRKTRQIIITIPVIAIIIIGVIMRFIHPELADARIDETIIFGIPGTVICGVAAVFIIGAVVFSRFNWRCPVCKVYLGKNTNPKFCPNCGAKFE